MSRRRRGDELPGLNAFRELLRGLPGEIEKYGPFEFVFRAQPPEHVRQLMRTLGVAIVVDPSAREDHVRGAASPLEHTARSARGRTADRHP